MRKILVTGGSGFIGTNLIDYYLSQNVRILNIDIVSPRNREHKHLWEKIDILDLPSLETAILDFNPTHVYHLAARTDLNEKKDINGYKANIDGVKNVISVLNKCQALDRVIFASSMFVCQPGYNPTHYDDYAPHTLYGESKVLTEKVIKNGNLNFDWLIIRPTSIWGPWFGEPYNEFFHRVKNGTYFKILGKTSTKTYGFIFNAIYQMDTLLFCDRSLVNEKTFYIGDDPGLNINNWAEEIATQLNIKLRKIPLFVLKAGGWFGEFLLLFNIKFPLQTFRVKNMTTDNIITLLKDTLKLAPKSPYTTKEGVTMTLTWLESSDSRFA